MQVIGAGWARTGTTSTLGALERLGFGPCYTFYTMMGEKPAHVQGWLDIYAGQPVDWREMFAGYTSVVDWPACDFYQDLLSVWPEAKVVLNVRDPETWYASMATTIHRFHAAMKAAGQTADQNPMVRLVDRIMWDGAFQGRFDDKQATIAAFERHTRAVIQSLPPEQLLVFDVTQGWEPLCQFLEVPVPEESFPRLNDRQTFWERLERNKQAPPVPADAGVR